MILSEEAARIAAGDVLGVGYEVIDVIGEGGMAVVYRARQKSLSRVVALKAMHPRFSADREFVTRFEREAGALAALNHPNIVSIIDRGQERNIYYFVMEFVDGETLDQKIIDNTLSLKEWREVIQACRDGLEFVHRRGVVHLDIKPSNILIDREGRAKISDFGIAHIVTGDDAAEEGPKRAFGTSYYMAPEQTAMPGAVDARADIYALSVTFYKMITRSMPAPDTVMPPSEVNTDIPVAVDAVIFRGMAPDREERYQNVRDFCDDLLKALKDTSQSLAAILDYRQKDQKSALYSGADFSAARSSSSVVPKVPAADLAKRTPVPGKAKAPAQKSEPEGRKPAPAGEQKPQPKPASGARKIEPKPATGSELLIKRLLWMVLLLIVLCVAILAVLMAIKAGDARIDPAELRPISQTDPNISGAPVATPAPTPIPAEESPAQDPPWEGAPPAEDTAPPADAAPQ
ncbi:MAG: protein kinase [Candidatus Sumerlaeia bacterium]|nr:protein kinase [Candidatus Sumerlaeia bacterium]